MSNLPPRPPALRGPSSRNGPSLARRIAYDPPSSSRERGRAGAYVPNPQHGSRSPVPPYSSRHSASSGYSNRAYEHERPDGYSNRYYDDRRHENGSRRGWDDEYERREGGSYYRDAYDRERYETERYLDPHFPGDSRGYSQTSYPRTSRYHEDTYAVHYGLRRRDAHPPERDDRQSSHRRYSQSPSRSRDETYRQQSSGSFHSARTPEPGKSMEGRPVSPESRRNEVMGRKRHPGSRRSSGEWSIDGHNPKPPSMDGRGRPSDGAPSGSATNPSISEVRMRSVSRSPSRKPSPPVKIRRPPKSNPPTSVPMSSSQPPSPHVKQPIKAPSPEPPSAFALRVEAESLTGQIPMSSSRPTPQMEQPRVQASAPSGGSREHAIKPEAANTETDRDLAKPTDLRPDSTAKGPMAPANTVPKAPPTEPRSFRTKEALAARSQISPAPPPKKEPPVVPKLRRRPLTEDLDEQIARHLTASAQAREKINSNITNLRKLQCEGTISTCELIALEDRRKIAERQRICLEKGIMSIEAFDGLVRDGLIEDLGVQALTGN